MADNSTDRLTLARRFLEPANSLLQEGANTLLSVLLNGIFGHHGRRALVCACELSAARSGQSMVRTMRKRAFPAIIFA